MNNKKGISLVILAVTVLVLVILASTVIYYVNDTMNNSKMSAFALDLRNVEDLVYEYYLNNDELPVDDDSQEYDKALLVSLITEGKEQLSEEITANKDDGETFCIIDLEKLTIESTTKGMQENEDIRDSYIVTKDSMNIYYLKGEKIGSKYYFSLTNDIVKKTELDIGTTLDNSEIEIIDSTSSIAYQKSTKDWTNALAVEVKTELEDDEILEYTLAGIGITESVTTNIVNVSEILLANQEIMTAFNNNKVLKIQKITNDGITISEANIDVSNLDILSGNSISQENVKHTKYDNYTLANISGYSDLGGSGLKEVRVLYTMKTDSEGNAAAYYDNLPQTITKEYIYSAGVRNESLLLKLPVDVTQYSLVFVDNAGNISDISTITVSY